MNINKLNAKEKVLVGMTISQMIGITKEALKDKKSDKNTKRVFKYIEFKLEEIQNEISEAISNDMVNSLEKIFGGKTDE